MTRPCEAVPVVSDKIVNQIANISTPILGRLPAVDEEHRRVVLLIGLGCTQKQAAKLTGFSAKWVDALTQKYKEHIRAVALEKDMCVVGVMDQAMGMIGDRLGEALENLNLEKATTGDVMKLAQSMESLQRTAWDIKGRASGDGNKQPIRPLNVTLESLDQAISKVRLIREGKPKEETVVEPTVEP